MLDLLKGSSPSAMPAAIPSARGQRLWAVLLVLDSLFVIVFGGALAAKVYQHWQAPTPAVASRHRPLPPKPVPPPPVNAPEPAKPAETSKPAPPKASQPKTPMARPSLLNEPPRHEAPKPKDSSSAPPVPSAAAQPEKAAKAVPVEFHLSAPDAQRVELSGAFIVRGGGRKKMAKQSDGTWTLTLYLTPNKYRYHFLVDGKKTLDPASSATDRGASVVVVGAP